MHNEERAARNARRESSARGAILFRFCILHSALCALLAGCGGAFQVRVDRRVAPPAEWVIAVFPLDDSAAEKTIREYTLGGRTGAQGSGAMLARCISRAVAAGGLSGRAQGPFRAMDETALRNLMLDEKLTSAELSRLEDGRAAELGRKLGANLVVRGKVLAFDRSWFLFLPRTTARLELRGLDPATGETLWSATLAESSMSRSEAPLISHITADALRAIAEGVGAPR
jgi:hypothetical protein